MQDKERKKTLIFVLVAGMALLVAWEPWRPAPADTSVPERVGQKLFPDFTNPLAAKSLEVVTFDEESAAVSDFRVAQQNGVWSIPSHNNYPADAKEHMAQAATALMDLTVLNMPSKMPGDQKTYGVITPDPEKLKVGMTGVGTRVTVRDGKDKALADLVIGKPVKDSPQLRYVREVGRDPIYTVRLNTNEFSTKFGDWIEKDLLKLNAFDVRNVELNDYSTRTGFTPDGQAAWQIDKRSEIDLSYDDAKSQWSLVDMQEFGPRGEASAVTLTEGEELDNEKLNNMKTALDDLQIIDVERKPTGLSQDLRGSEEFVKNREAIMSLAERGFLFGAMPGGEPQIYSSEGEVTATTKDGVKYILRFGDLAGAGGEEKSDDADAEAKSTGPSRYLFVTAQLDESQIPKPELKQIPGEEEPAAEKPDAEKPDADKPDADKPDADKPDAEKPDEATQPSDEKPATEEPPADKPADEAKPADDTKPAAEVPETKTAAQEDGAAPAKAEESTEPAADQPAAETPAAEEEKGEPAAEAEKPEPPTPAEQEKIAIRQENKRQQDEYDAAVKRGQDKVKELNDRFADWYFIISDDVYKKIHLGRADIIQKKPVESTKDLGNLKDLEQGLAPPAVP